MKNDVPPTVVGKRFSNAARTYDSAAVLQRGIAERLLALAHRHMPTADLNEVWADLGCGTGYLTQRLQSRHGGSLWGIDLSHAMLQQARQRCSSNVHWVQANACTLPFVANTIDRFYSSLALQWAGDLSVVLAHLYRVLKPGGWLAMTTLNAQTLHELDQVQKAAGGQLSGHRFATAASIIATVQAANFHVHAHQVQDFIRYHPSVHTLMRDLKRLGAQSRPEASPEGLKGRQWLRALEHHACSIMQPEGMPARYATHFLILQKPNVISVQELL